ncbi:hypothetical protein IHC92_17390 [Photobacterium damselae subsp. damselae]|uniref:hypothetical protein n=1 Tax=Photobacterium damselae TaxID=38293 RepID=UPI001F4383D2|nr:hypothetical protein [Photobacterium damselae]UJZ96353.1 hypothetical protein IHC87_17450 [Photobacterium damselae subsp. damselae]UJZ99742.1 hypothetical protein IHC88_20040 [Photobacterium damselae subsp. damselae]UKA08861.1 hypothetical protein IHC90_17805 [Photobacterium damselae subsp. damselae]UKA12686.1 hypothetical protein IHC91_17420 [Photobacterium damselae subsp. damselae]UKA23936.1 hypothetical protein IHC92_17390 [Photobacterium damselae subsp. damselae]
MLNKTDALGAAGSVPVIGYSLHNSLEHPQSLLNSTMSQIIDGSFTMYGSDWSALIGLGLTIIGISVTIWRIFETRKLIGKPGSE